MKFVVTMEASTSKDVEIEADTPEEAVKKARDSVKTLDAVAITDAVSDEKDEKLWRVVGFCEGCSEPILAEQLGHGHEESEHYGYDDEGTYTCAKCLADYDEGGEA